MSPRYAHTSSKITMSKETKLLGTKGIKTKIDQLLLSVRSYGLKTKEQDNQSILLSPKYSPFIRFIAKSLYLNHFKNRKYATRNKLKQFLPKENTPPLHFLLAQIYFLFGLESFYHRNSNSIISLLQLQLVTNEI